MTKGNRAAGWSSKSLAGSFGYSLFYAAIRLGGAYLAYCMLFFVAAYYTLKPSIRARSEPYLSRRFPGRGPLEQLLNAFKLNFEFGKVLVDRAVMGLLGKGEITAPSDLEECLTGLISRGKGLIILTSHVGCWQSAMAGLESIKTPRALLLHQDPEDADRHYFEHRAGETPFRIIDPHGPLGGSLEMVETLKKGHILCLTGDRTLGSKKNTVQTEFLGGRIRTPISAFSLASAVGSPIAILFSKRSGRCKGIVWLEKVIEVPVGLGRNPEVYRPFAQSFIDALEAYADSCPFQFFNHFDMWSPENDSYGPERET